MSVWWTYRLDSFVLFSAATWQRLLELHNQAWWPWQWVAVVMALWLTWLPLRSVPHGGWHARAGIVVLALAWLVAGIAFHWQRYASINWAASWMAGAFMLQALGLAVWAARARSPRLLPSAIGIGLLGCAALLHPLAASALGRPWAQAEVFALMPDPTAIATLGLLLCLRGGGATWWLRVVPVLWCIVSGATLWVLQAPLAWWPPLAALLAVGASLIERRRTARDAAG